MTKTIVTKTIDPFAAERSAVEISVALNLLLDYGLPERLIKDLVNHPNMKNRRLVASLIPRIWPDPDQCPDQC